MPSALPSWIPALKPALTIGLLSLFWTWKTVCPLIVGRAHRWRHARRNLIIAVLNTILLSVVFGTATLAIATWASAQEIGLLNGFRVPSPWRWIIAVLLLDAWLYTWHRLNHRIPFLWRFHRMHHADGEMDVTTATRFHIGEHLGAATLRLGLIPLLGVNILEIVTFEILVVAVTMFHHANLSLGRIDPPLRWLMVTPRMHQVHHSRYQPETDSNYSTVLSCWDRLFQTYRMRPGPEPIELGLDEISGPRWQTVGGMLATPFVNLPTDLAHRKRE